MRLNNNLAFLCIIAVLVSLFGYLSIIEETENFIPTSLTLARTGTIGVTVAGNITFQANLTTPDNVKLNATFSFVSPTRTRDSNATDGNLSVILYTDTCNITASAFSSNLNFTLLNVPITEDISDALRLDNPSSSVATLLLPSNYEFTDVYVIRTPLTYDSVNLTLKYDNPSQVSEADLKPYRCANYNFETRTCSGTWAIVSVYTQNTTVNTFTFTLTSLSAFAIGASLPAAAPPAAGGGGGFAPGEFGVDKETIKVKLKQGETKKETLKITNIGTTRLTIKIDVENIKDFVSIDKDKFTLQRDESEVVLLTFAVPSDQKPDVYVGKIVVKGDGTSKEIPTAIEVVTKGPVFDVVVEIPEAFKKVKPGEEVMAKTTIYNLEKLGLIDISVEYFIKDIEGNVIANESESMAIETQISTVKSLKIPEDAKRGDYVFYVRVSYDGIIGIGSDTFKVTPIAIISVEVILLLIVSLVILVFVIILYNQYKAIKKAIERYGMVTDKQIIKPGFAEKLVARVKEEKNKTSNSSKENKKNKTKKKEKEVNQ